MIISKYLIVGETWITCFVMLGQAIQNWNTQGSPGLQITYVISLEESQSLNKPQDNHIRRLWTFNHNWLIQGFARSARIVTRLAEFYHMNNCFEELWNLFYEMKAVANCSTLPGTLHATVLWLHKFILHDACRIFHNMKVIFTLKISSHAVNRE